jgi:hypothetical protein
MRPNRPNRKIPRYLRPWTGGGTFRADRDILLRESEDGITPIENVPIPSSVRVRASLKSFEHKLSAYAPTSTESAEHRNVAEALSAAGLKWVDWISLRDDNLLCARMAARPSLRPACGRHDACRLSRRHVSAGPRTGFRHAVVGNDTCHPGLSAAQSRGPVANDELDGPGSRIFAGANSGMTG